METQPRLRDRKKVRTREALLSAATRLYLSHGYDTTTVDEIAEAAGVARRTFFRYFARKDETVFPLQAERIAMFRERLASHRAEAAPFEAVVRACLELAAVFSETREHLVVQARIMNASVSLIARQAEFDREWEQAIYETLLPSTTPGPAEERHARVFAGAVMGMVRATLDAWQAGARDLDLARLGAEALAWIEQGYTASLASLSVTP
jgi:AcrR family transcriptional regulator